MVSCMLCETCCVRLSDRQMKKIAAYVKLGSWESESDFVRGAVEREFRRLAEEGVR